MTKSELEKKVDELQRNNADLIIRVYHLEKENSRLLGQLAEYHGVLLSQKRQIETLEKRLEIYK